MPSRHNQRGAVEPAQMPDPEPDPDPDPLITVQTEFGPVRAPVKVVRLWNINGWPNDATLRWMVAHPPADPDPQERP